MLLVVLVLILLFGLGGGYYGHQQWGYSGGVGVSLSTVIAVLLIAWVLGAFR